MGLPLVSGQALNNNVTQAGNLSAGAGTIQGNGTYAGTITVPAGGLVSAGASQAIGTNTINQLTMTGGAAKFEIQGRERRSH